MGMHYFDIRESDRILQILDIIQYSTTFGFLIFYVWALYYINFNYSQNRFVKINSKNRFIIGILIVTILLRIIFISFVRDNVITAFKFIINLFNKDYRIRINEQSNIGCEFYDLIDYNILHPLLCYAVLISNDIKLNNSEKYKKIFMFCGLLMCIGFLFNVIMADIWHGYTIDYFIDYDYCLISPTMIWFYILNSLIILGYFIYYLNKCNLVIYFSSLILVTIFDIYFNITFYFLPNNHTVYHVYQQFQYIVVLIFCLIILKVNHIYLYIYIYILFINKIKNIQI